MKLTNTEKQILKIMQDEFPLDAKPYKKIAEKLNLPEKEVLENLKVMAKKGILRRIGPSFSLDKVKRKSALAAASVSAKNIKRAAKFINQYGEVTHNYLRDHKYNVWFTVIAPSQKRIKQIIKEIEENLGVKVILLPKTKTYKINVKVKL